MSVGDGIARAMSATGETSNQSVFVTFESPRG